MFTDIVGYTALTQRNEALALQLVERHWRIVRPILARYRGKEVKTIGDAFLIEFASALQATECAFEIQKVLKDYNEIAESPTEEISVRIGIHIGDVVRAKGDVFGAAVNIASRIEPLAKGGGVCISGQVYDQVRNKIPYKATRLDNAQLKNVASPVEVYRLDLPWDKANDPSPSNPLPADRIAVLPFVNISPDPNDEYFADGLTEELIANLSLVRGLKIIARTSVMNYKKEKKSVAVIGRELGVGTVVEGSIRKAGNRIRVTVQMIDVNSEEHLWASNYDRSLDDIFAVQSDIAARVAESLPKAMISKSKAPEPQEELKDTENVNAYMYFLHSRQLVYSADATSLRKSLELFDKALELDPYFARAYVGKARGYISLGAENILPWKQAIESAEEAIDQALALNPSLSSAHATLSELAYMSDDLERCASEARRAIELNPNLADAYYQLGEYVALKGDINEYVRLLETAHQLDPLSPIIVRRYGTALLYAGRRDEARDHWYRTLHLDPFNAYRGLADYFMIMGDYDQAAEMVSQLEKLQPLSSVTLLNIGFLAALRGDRQKAEAVIRTMRENYPRGSVATSYAGLIYFALGDRDKFFDQMKESAANNTIPAAVLLRHPIFAEARRDPRMRELLSTLGITLH
jgi:adenylate cyclase